MNKLNRKSFNDKFYDDIVSGIKNKFSKMYDKEITVKYNSESACFYFSVYVEGKTISINDEIVNTNIFIDKYDNVTAVKLFSMKYSMEDFNKKYNDYSLDNHKKLQEEIDKLVEEYEKAGFVFTNKEVSDTGYCVYCYHPLYSRINTHFGKKEWNIKGYGGGFSVHPISTSTMRNALRDVKNNLERFNGECVQAALTGGKI